VAVAPKGSSQPLYRRRGLFRVKLFRREHTLFGTGDNCGFEKVVESGEFGWLYHGWCQ
jgi:hypothetical protein